MRRHVSNYDAATTARMNDTNDTSLDYKGFVHSKPKKLNSTSTLGQIRTNRHLSGDTTISDNQFEFFASHVHIFKDKDMQILLFVRYCS